jgi:AraC-like DNA-binding protein
VETLTDGPQLPEHQLFQRILRLGHREAVLFPDLVALPPGLIHGAGFLENAPPANYWDGERWGKTELVMILYTLRGRGKIRHEGGEWFLEPGQAALLRFPQDQRHWLEDDGAWEYFYVTLAGQTAVRDMQQIISRMGPIVGLDVQSSALALMANACAAALESSIETPYRSSELARAMTVALHNETIAKLDHAGRPLASAPAFVFEVEQFCRRNLSRPIGVEDMARVARLSRYHFSRKFEAARGISPGRYLANLRLDEATRLLSHGRHSVKEAAAQCGYGDANYFCKVFRRSFGVSPGKVRFAATS